MSTRCAVLGRPVAHSLSPVLHRAAYDVLGLDWSYDAVEVDEAALAAFLGGLDTTWRGLSLTMPLKRAVVPLLDEASELVARSGVANTVLLESGRRRGENTDVPGAVRALRERVGGDLPTAVVLGGGATAASVLLALGELGCRTATVLVRDPARAAETVAVVGNAPDAPEVEVAVIGGSLPAADVLVSTVPTGAQTPDLVRSLGAPVVFDVVYDPWPTPLAAAARADGRTLVGGLDLLVHQAALQVALMTGAEEVPVEAMRRAGERALATRTGG